MNTAVYDRLTQVAKEGKVITYKELGYAANLDVSSLPDLDKLTRILAEIADHEIALGRPLLIMVVVREDLGMPAKGLFKYTKAKGIQDKKMEDIAFFAEEIKRVYAAWKPG